MRDNKDPENKRGKTRRVREKEKHKKSTFFEEATTSFSNTTPASAPPSFHCHHWDMFRSTTRAISSRASVVANATVSLSSCCFYSEERGFL